MISMKKGLCVLCVGILAVVCLMGCGQEKQNVTYNTKYPSAEETAVEVAQSESEEDLKKQEEGQKDENGKVDLTAARDAKGDLKSLVKATQEEFDKRTARQKEMEQEMENSVGEVATTACYEGGNADETANALDEYKIYGVSYDKENEYWVYNEKPIHIFYDEQGCTLSDGSVSHGVNVKVIRGVSGKIEKLSEVTEEEINKLLERN